ncbi:hypothetical protein HWV62_2077 [Athelia sp. TMB]|nr:hypothetical protein HWV62_2077 [Athelia sp. TMB]
MFAARFRATSKSTPFRELPGISKERSVTNMSDVKTDLDNQNRPNEGQVTDNDGALPPLVMQIILDHSRRTIGMLLVVELQVDASDIWSRTEDGWGYGPLMAQTAHAATAVLHETREREETIQYLADLRSMHKVVLETADLSSLRKLSAMLSAEASPGSSVPHHLWIEQPENIPTCIAIAPYRKGDKLIRKALDKSKCRLWKD